MPYKSPQGTPQGQVSSSRKDISETKEWTPSFVIEGNIGVGKSTLLNLCRSDEFFEEHFKIYCEPIEKWQNVGGKGRFNILDEFYRDSKGKAYLFQNFVFITRFLQHQKALHENHPRLLERSVWTDKFVFAKAVSETKLMSELEYEVYSAWYEPVVHVLPALVPDAFIYLQADPEVCYDRLKTRNRSEESSVPLDYLKLLHRKHEHWFIKGSDPVQCKEEGIPSGTQIRRLVGSRTHKLLDGIPVLVVNSNRHLKPHERTALKSAVMKFVTRDCPITTTKVCEETKMLTPLRTTNTTDSLGQAVTTPTPDENEGTLKLDFDRVSTGGIIVD